MKLIEVADYQAMCQEAANYLVERIQMNPTIRLGLATGGTPLGTYARLVEDYKRNGTSYENVVTFNLDEYIGLTAESEQSYRYYMNKHFFNEINIKKENTFVPNGAALHPDEECLQYENKIREHGGIDVQLLGIGRNGHIGFNEPGASFDSTTHVVMLTPNTREANARYFSQLDDVPKQAITMGIGTILKSREILLLVSGEAKREALARMRSDELTEEFPASILQTHPHVTIIADLAALGKTTRQEAKSYD